MTPAYPQQPQQPQAPYGAPPPPAKKSNVGKIVGGCLLVLLLSCCCCSGLGGYVAFLDNRSLYTLGDEVSRTPIVLGAPQQVSVAFDGSGYAFVQIWADIEVQQAGPEVELSGTVTCQSAYGGGTYPTTFDAIVGESNATVAEYERSGDHLTASVHLGNEYMHAGESPRACTVVTQLRGGTLTSGQLVTRAYQRPSDRFAN